MTASSSTRTTDSPHRLAHEELRSLCEAAVRGAGGSADMASALARATVDAEARGQTAVGAAHLPDYLDALRSGRLDGAAEPRVTGSRAAALTVDAANGTAQQAFESVIDDLVGRARDAGVAVLSIHRSFTAGELGYYARRLAAQGLIALTGSNSPALVSVHGAREAVTGTNPMAFALPHPDGPRMFDQAASATAWVNVRAAADRGEAIPDGWALDPQGEPTTDAAAGMLGALLPFGGAKAANIALMIELLAVLSGGEFSLDAAPFDAGEDPPSVGLFAVAIDPTAFDPGYADRAEEHLQRLTAEHGVDFGRRKTPPSHIDLSRDVYEALARSIPADTAQEGAS